MFAGFYFPCARTCAFKLNFMEQDFHIRTGLPNASAPASFSRFVLPFSYFLRLAEEPSPKPWFEPVEPHEWLNDPSSGGHTLLDQDARENYMTNETGRVMFERAKWYKLAGGEARNVDLGSGKELQLSAPALVLFEMSHDEQVHFSLLQTGFLVFEISFSTETDATLLDLLTLNEVLRFWKLPYKEYGQRPILSFGMQTIQQLLSVGGAANNVFLDWFGPLELLVKRDDSKFFRLLPGSAGDPSKKALKTEWKDKEVKRANFQPDDRAYVWTAAIHCAGLSGQQKDGKPADFVANEVLSTMAVGFDGGPCAPVGGNCAPWVKLLNVDRSGRRHRD